MQKVRVLPFETLPGPLNMALDEYLTWQALEYGLASFRWYAWQETTVTLGYFQSVQELQAARPELSACPWVRRSSGGGTLVHDPAHELTYALALPPSANWKPPTDNWICQMHRYLRSALAHFNVPARLVVCGEEKKLEPFLCFQHQTPGDLLIGQHKVAGSAQRRLKGAIGQHGSVTFSRSPLTPHMPGVAELSGVKIDFSEFQTAFLNTLRDDAGWMLEPGELSESDWGKIRQIADEKYTHPDWNHKR